MIELTNFPRLRKFLISRWPQWLVTAISLAIFLYAAIAGEIGTQVGSRNLAITLVWIAWWALLILILVPVGGRIWCSVCPIPVVGDWFQRGAFLTPAGRKPRGLKRRWPRRLRNLWVQNLEFLSLALFSIVILTQPRVSGFVLIALLLAAFIVAAVFQRRTFCRYLCPVGGFIGLYSLVSPIALRVRDPEICRKHPTKDCFRGNERGHGCPWIVFPGTLERNTNCGLCMECLRTCDLDNVALVLRRPGEDLAPNKSRPPLRMDEAYKGFIMLASAIVYSIVLLGPWGNLKQAANDIGSLPWLVYATILISSSLVLIPALYLLAAGMGNLLSPNRILSLRDQFLRSAVGLVPLGLSAWIAFSLSFALVNGSYILATFSDPLGWGWNLFGTASYSWTPIFTAWIPRLQFIILLGGLAWGTAITARNVLYEVKISLRNVLATLPTLLVNGVLIATLLWIYV